MSNPKYIYAIYESNFGKLVVERAVVVKATQKRYKIVGDDGQHTGLAFGCASVVSPGRYPESPEEAWALYRDEQRTRMGQHLKEAERCRARAEQAATEAGLL